MDELNEQIKRAQEGDKNAFGEIYQLFYQRIYRYCYNNLFSSEAAQDICQETFMKAWSSFKKFSLKNGGSLQAFLFRIARNLIIDQSRKKKTTSLEEYGEIERIDDLEGKIDRLDERKKVHQILKSLPELERNILLLRFFEDLSLSEVAKVVKMNEGALRVRLHRILKKFKLKLNEEGTI